MTEFRTNGPAAWTVLTLGVLTGLYVATYYVIVTPVQTNRGRIAMEPFYGEVPTINADDYDECWERSERLAVYFAPIHLLDRQFRSATWKVPPDRGWE